MSEDTQIECQRDSSKINGICYVSFFCMLRILGDCATNSDLPQPGPPSIVQIPSSLWLQMVVKLSLTSPSWVLFKASEAAMCSNDAVGVSSDGQPREFEQKLQRIAGHVRAVTAWSPSQTLATPGRRSNQPRKKGSRTKGVLCPSRLESNGGTLLRWLRLGSCWPLQGFAHGETTTTAFSRSFWLTQNTCSFQSACATSVANAPKDFWEAWSNQLASPLVESTNRVMYEWYESTMSRKNSRTPASAHTSSPHTWNTDGLVQFVAKRSIQSLNGSGYYHALIPIHKALLLLNPKPCCAKWQRCPEDFDLDRVQGSCKPWRPSPAHSALQRL